MTNAVQASGHIYGSVEVFITKNKYVSFGLIHFQEVSICPFVESAEARGDVKVRTRKFRKSRKDPHTKIIISIAHTLKASISKSIR